MNQIEQLQQAGFSKDEIDAYINKTRTTLQNGGFSEDEINNYLGLSKFNNKDLTEHIRTYISKDEPDSFWDKFLKSFEPPWAERRAKSYKALVGAEKAKMSPSKFEPTLTDAFKQGYQGSVTGLIQKGKLPETIIANEAMKYLPTRERLALQVGQLAGDFPFMTIGAIFGGATGGPAAPLTAAGGAFGLPAGLRKLYMDKYEKGEITSFSEFWQRLGDSVMETLKGQALGIATAATGAAIPGAISYPAEIATLATIGAGLEGTIPEPKDFVDAAILVGGMKAAGLISSRMRQYYAKTGQGPYELIKRVETDPSLKEKLLSSNFEQRKVKIPKGKRAKKLSDDEKAILETISIGEKQKKSYGFNDLYTDLVDKLHPLGNVVKKMLDGEAIPIEQDPYKLARNFAGSKGIADHFLEYSPVKFSDKSNIGKPLKEILKDTDVTKFRIYAKSKRAIEIEAQGKKSGINIEAAKRVVKANKDKYEPIFREFVKYQDYPLQYLKDSGIISNDLYNKIKELNKDYVSFARVIDTAKSGVGKGLEAYDPIKALKGSELKTIDPIESAIKNTYFARRKK